MVMVMVMVMSWTAVSSRPSMVPPKREGKKRGDGGIIMGRRGRGGGVVVFGVVFRRCDWTGWAGFGSNKRGTPAERAKRGAGQDGERRQ